MPQNQKSIPKALLRLRPAQYPSFDCGKSAEKQQFRKKRAETLPKTLHSHQQS